MRPFRPKHEAISAKIRDLAENEALFVDGAWSAKRFGGVAMGDFPLPFERKLATLGA
jgi:hypothetical protein